MNSETCWKLKSVRLGGSCPVHKVGDRIVIEGAEIVLSRTVCVHALSTLLHYVVALDEGADSVRLGLSKPGDREHAYIQCVDPGEPYTDGGTVIFKIKRVKQKGQSLKVEEEG